MNDIEKYERISYVNLKALAREMAINYAEASTVDVPLRSDQNQIENSDGHIRPKIEKILENVVNYNRGEPDLGIPENTHGIVTPETETSETLFTRNVLVLGAGCTANAFGEKIPLADSAKNMISQKIIIHTLKDEKSNNNGLEITLYHALQCYCELKKEDDFSLNTFRETDYQIVEDNRYHHLKHEFEHNEITIQAFDQFFREYKKIFFSSQDRRDNIDFETYLTLIRGIVPSQKLRKAIQDIYNYQHCPTLFYELVAHLFKQRFFDVIINFNFDELLDTAIEEELGEGNYDIILSDGDCRSLEKELSINGKIRQPIYIKPHGTARHQSTLRFTKDHYFELPSDIRRLIEEIVESKDLASDGGEGKRVNLIVAGFNLESVEFNEILRSKLPKQSKLFFFYYRPLWKDDDEEYLNRCDSIKEKLYIKDKPIQYYLINDEYFKKVTLKNLNLYGKSKTEKFELRYETSSLGNCFAKLYDQITTFLKPQFKPRNISKHLLLALLFGNKRYWKNQYGKKTPKSGEFIERIHFLDHYFKTSTYFKDRILIEILIRLIRGGGRIDLPVASTGRIGRYYALYRNAFFKEKEENQQSDSSQKSINRLPIPLSRFIGFYQKKTTIENIEISSQNVPLLNPLKINHIDINIESGEKLFEGLLQRVKQDVNHDFFSMQFARFLLLTERALKPTSKVKIENQISRLLQVLVGSTKCIIRNQFRGNQHHIFDDFDAVDLINTDLAFDLEFYQMMKDPKVKTICAIAEHGIQVAKFLDDIFSNKELTLYFILSTTETKEKNHQEIKDYNKSLDSYFTLIRTKYNDKYTQDELKTKIKVLFLYLNRHNHHMTFSLNGNNEMIRAVYYYQQGLNKYMSPLAIGEKNNKMFVGDKFEKYSDSAKFFSGKTVDESFNWINDIQPHLN